MKCVICKNGTTKNGFTTITLEKNNSTIVFKHVPALVCSNCGEKYVEDDVTRDVLKTAKEIQESGVEIDVRDFSLNVA